MENTKKTRKNSLRNWLNAEDIEAIANSKYSWNHDTGFEIVGSPAQFQIALNGNANDTGMLERLRKRDLQNAIFVINQENGHWISVVISRNQDGNLNAYWADSLGKSDIALYNQFKEYTTYLVDEKIFIRNLSNSPVFPAQEDDYSCGIHALINANVIVGQLAEKNELSSLAIVAALIDKRSERINSLYEEGLLIARKRRFLVEFEDSLAELQSLEVKDTYQSKSLYEKYGPQIQIMSEVLRLLTPNLYHYDPYYEPAENFLKKFEWNEIRLDYSSPRALGYFFSSLLIPLTYGQEEMFSTSASTCSLPNEFLEGAQAFVEKQFGSECEEKFIVDATMAYQTRECRMTMNGESIYRFASRIGNNLQNLIDLDAITTTDLKGLAPSILARDRATGEIAKLPPEYLDGSQTPRIALCITRILLSSIYNLRYRGYREFASRLIDELENFEPILLNLYESGNNRDVSGISEVLQRFSVEKGLIMYQNGRFADAKAVWNGIIADEEDQQSTWNSLSDYGDNPALRSHALGHLSLAILLYSSGHSVDDLISSLDIYTKNLEEAGVFPYLVLQQRIAAIESNQDDGGTFSAVNRLRNALLEAYEQSEESLEDGVYLEALLGYARLLKNAGRYQEYRSVARSVIENAIVNDSIGADYILDASQMLDIIAMRGYIIAMRQAWSDSALRLESLKVAAFKKALSAFVKHILKPALKVLPEAFDAELVSELKKSLGITNQSNHLSISDINFILDNSNSISTSSLLYLRIVTQDEVSQQGVPDNIDANRVLETISLRLGQVRDYLISENTNP